MMMTSGQAVKYKGSMDCAVQILKNEGFMSMMKGAGQCRGKIGRFRRALRLNTSASGVKEASSLASNQGYGRVLRDNWEVQTRVRYVSRWRMSLAYKGSW